MSGSPVHVHVQDNIPLHVHVKKPKRNKNPATNTSKTSSLRSTSRSTARSKPKPWVPAPGRTKSVDSKLAKSYQWESDRSKLEVNQPPEVEVTIQEEAPLKTEDLTTEQDNKLRDHLLDYEKKIEQLMAEVGTLKNEQEVSKLEEVLEKKDVILSASKAALYDKEKELEGLAKEYEESEKENQRLKRSLGKYQEDLNASLQGMPSSDTDVMRQLIAVELSSTEAGKQVAALRDVVARLQYEKKLAPADIDLLNRQRDLLLSRLEEFETCNRNTRRIVQAQHGKYGDFEQAAGQRDMLMKKMADYDTIIVKLQSENLNNQAAITQLQDQVEEEKKHTRTLNELNKSVESTRAHLQRELRAKEMENNRLHVQLKTIEKQTESMQKEASDLTSLAKSERNALSTEKDGLKRAIRSQRIRAEKAEASLEGALARCDEREKNLHDLRAQADVWRERYQVMYNEKNELHDEVDRLSKNVIDLESRCRSNDVLSRGKEESLQRKIEGLIKENGQTLAALEKQKSENALSAEKLLQQQKEAAGLRDDVKNLQSVNADLEIDLKKAKNETDEALLNSEKIDREARKMREEGAAEVEKVKEQMLERMKDLQTLPDVLKETELRLQDTQDKLHVYEQRSTEQTRIIAELTSKAEDRTDESESLRQKLAASQDINRALEARIEILHAKLDDRDSQVKENALDNVNKDEKIQQLKLKLDETECERDSFKRQLENAVSESRTSLENEKSKATARDNITQARIVDLETQITRLKTDAASVKRQKEDGDRRAQSKLQDVRDRLEQAEATNRSMRNYVNFLKTSYNNVFGTDASLTSTPVRSSAPDRSGSPF